MSGRLILNRGGGGGGPPPPDHRRNMLNCDFNAIGVGVVSGPGGPWWTQDFGRS
ncbi:CAP domain-containing protein [Nonomuraea corallina]|uniref:CAP domain-containing protein n=1 Tax=Nonomuraea corallina TaxID=2989783 RepID=UPI002FD86206